MVVYAAAGLGVAVVDGAVEPDEIRIRKRDTAVTSTASTITTRQIQELAVLLVAVERFFNAPQDVEWCFDGAGFWIVQSRPITVRPHRGFDIEWTRANL